METSDTCDEDHASLGDPFSRRASSSGAGQAQEDYAQPGRERKFIASDRFRASFSRSFVLPSAWDGWDEIHERPVRAFVCGVLGTLSTILVNSFVLTIASKPVRWGHHTPSVIYTCCHTTTLLLVWRFGPLITRKRAYYAIFGVSVFLQVGVSARLMLGPDIHVPFGNRLVFALVNAVTTWTWVLAGMMGCWAVDHPREPYRSLAPAFINATVRTLRLTDGITDMLVIRLILQQAHEPCFWFGANRSCLRWHIMAGFASLFASVDLALSVFYGMSGSRVETTGRDGNMRRLYKGTHIVSFTCEVGILTVTLVKLFSSFNDPETSISYEERRKSVTLILVSFMVTIATFSLTMVGLKRIVSAVTRVGVSVRSRFSNASARSRATRASVPGQQRSASGRRSGRHAEAE